MVSVSRVIGTVLPRALRAGQIHAILASFLAVVLVLNTVCGAVAGASRGLLCAMMMRINSASPSPPEA
jgi:hypothetical protein